METLAPNNTASAGVEMSAGSARVCTLPPRLFLPSSHWGGGGAAGALNSQLMSALNNNPRFPALADHSLLPRCY